MDEQLGIERLQAIVIDALRSGIGLDDDEVAATMRAIEGDLAARVGAGRMAALELWRDAARDVLAASRAAVPLGGDAWWRSDGAASLRSLTSGYTAAALAQVGEAIAGPDHVDIDFNWPPSKLAVDIDSNWPPSKLLPPRGVGAGDTFVVGDGDGGRAEARVVDRGGRLVVEVLPETYRLLTEEVERQVEDELDRLLGELG